MELGSQLEPRAHQQGPYPLRSIKLVATEAEQVDAQFVDGKRDVAGGLGRVHVQQHSPLPAEGGDSGQGLEHADFVVGGHHAQQQHVVAEGGFELG